MKPPIALPAVHSVLVSLLLVSAAAGQGMPPPRNPIEGKFFPAELILRHKDEIGLTEPQRAAMDEALDAAQTSIPELREKLKDAVAALTQLADKTEVNKEAILAQFDKVMDLERELKKTELTIALTLRAQLTAEQQTQLRELRAKEERARGPRDGMGRNLPPEVAGKVQRIRAGVEKLQREGGDPQPIVEKWREVEALMRAGKPDEANKMLDQVLRMVEQGDK